MTMWRDGDTINVDWDGHRRRRCRGRSTSILNPEMFKMFVGVFLIMAFAPDVVFNDGYSDIIKVNIPEGSVLKPEFPAPLGNRLTLMARHFDVFGAVFSKMLGLQFAVSGSYGTSPNFVYSGTDSKGENYQILEILYGGIPARPAGDGLDGHSWWPLFKAVPTEYLEKYYPLRVESYSVRTDSGGAGYHRGGHGVAKDVHVPRGRAHHVPGRSRPDASVGRERRQVRPELVEDADPRRRARSGACPPRSRTCRCTRATG